MPPKYKFEEKDILDAAFKILRKKGMAALTARAIAKELKTSTAPIYSQIKSMKKIKEALIGELWELYYEYLTKPITRDVILDYSIGYILFALREKYLFRCFYDESFTKLHQNYVEIYEKRLSELFANHPYYTSIPDQDRETIILKNLCSLHGLADLLNHSPRKEFVELRKDEKKIIEYITKDYQHGLFIVEAVKAYIKTNPEVRRSQTSTSKNISNEKSSER
jgi:AcrR family transcriptional regulator